MFERVLVLSASVGAGHMRAAQAIEKALLNRGAAQQVQHIDALEYTSKFFRKLYQKLYFDLLTSAPEVVGWAYDQLDKPWKNERLRLALDTLNTRRFIKLIESHQPDLVVCTHHLPAELISWLKEKNRLNTRQAIVVTDFDVHALWLCRHFEHYFVACDETRAYLELLGWPPEKVTATGIPIDPVFAEPRDKTEMRIKHSLLPDRTTILVSAGGFGLGPVSQIIEILANMRHEAQVVAICGRSQELCDRLRELARRHPANHPLAIHVVGHTNVMEEYMSAADLVLGKPGGLTTFESLAKGLGFVIVNPIPGQEERNADHLLEEGVAIRCNNLPLLAYKLDRLLDDPARLARMQSNALRLGRPNAANDIVDVLTRM